MNEMQKYMKWRKEYQAKIAKARARYHCPKCGVKQPNETHTCPDCGAKITDVRRGFPTLMEKPQK